MRARLGDRRAALVLVGALWLGGAVYAAAAGLPFASTGLGSAWAPTVGCTTAGLSVLSNLSGNNVVSVTVSTLPASCAGATLGVTVRNGVATGSGSASVPAGGGSVTVVLGSATAVTTQLQTDLVLVGP